MRLIKWLMAGLLLAGSLSFAQVNNYYVSNLGSDANSAASVLNSGGSVSWATMQHAMGLMTPGASGTILNVAAGTYLTTNSTCGISTNFCANQDGTPSARLTIQCSNPIAGCKLTGAPAGGYDVIIKANYVDFVGFEVGPCSACNAGIAVLGGTSFSNKGTNIHVISNYVHDIAQTGNDGNGFGNGCPSSGMIIADFKGQNIPGLQLIGNRLNNGGLMSLTSCNQFHGLYINGATLAQNNLISNIVGEGINFGPSPCGGALVGNTVFHTGQRGILIASYSGDNCASNGGDGHMTVNMNIADNNGVNNSGVGCGIGESGAVGTTNLYSNNLLQGNSHGDTVCLQTNPPGSVVNLKHEATSSTFTAYNDNGLGTYSLNPGSIAVGGGTTNCAVGGFPSCAPTIDFTGTTRPNPPSIGAFDVGAAPPTPFLTLVPTSTAFGNVLRNTSSTLPVTLSNNNGGTVTISSAIVAGAGFSATPAHPCVGPLASNASCNFNVTCSPTVAGAISGTLTFTHNASNNPSIETLSCTGTAPNGHVQIPIPPTGLNFGSQQVGTPSGSQPVTYQNIGTAPLTFSSIVANGDFSIVPGSNTCPVAPATLAVAGTCSLSLIFTPTIVGTRNGTLLFNSNDPLSPQTVALTGIGQQGVIPPTGIVFQQGVIGVN